MNRLKESLFGFFDRQKVVEALQQLTPEEELELWGILEQPKDWDDMSDSAKALFLRRNARLLM